MSMEPVNVVCLIFCCSLLLLPSVFPSIKVLSSESALCIRWPNYWRFNFSNSPSSEYSELISFRIDWFYLSVQMALKSLLQHQNSKASILWFSVFFMDQISHLYMTSGKNHSFGNTDFCSYNLYLRANLLLLTRLYPSIGSTWFSVYSLYALAYLHFGCWEHNIRSCCDSYLPVFSPTFSSVQFSSVVQSCLTFATPCTTAHQDSLSVTNSWSLLKLMSIKLVVASNCIILCRPLLLLSSIFPSIRVFPMSQFFTTGGQSIGVSASASVCIK